MSVDLGVILVAGATLGGVAIAIAHSLIAEEVRGWLPHLSRRLVRSAVRRLPPTSQARYESEWLAELVAWEDRPLSALAKAAHLRWGANGIRESLCGASVKGDRLKRAFDLGFASGLLVLLAPVLIATAIAIKLESRGPVFLRQPRTGRRNTTFQLIKFRSMYVDAEQRQAEVTALNEANGVMFKLLPDPRITRVGRFIRRYSLDELPQLINVLRGEMSLVGPRPLIFPASAALEEKDEPARSEVRPGLTGYWQIYRRSDHGRKAFQEMIKLDTEYVRSRSFLLDLRVLLRTVLERLRTPR